MKKIILTLTLATTLLVSLNNFTSTNVQADEVSTAQQITSKLEEFKQIDSNDIQKQLDFISENPESLEQNLDEFRELVETQTAKSDELNTYLNYTLSESKVPSVVAISKILTGSKTASQVVLEAKLDEAKTTQEKIKEAISENTQDLNKNDFKEAFYSLFNRKSMKDESTSVLKVKVIFYTVFLLILLLTIKIIKTKNKYANSRRY